MNLITVPLSLGNKAGVTNLQAALLFLLNKQILSITSDELKALQNQWQKEQWEADYGDATTRLVAFFQEQYKIDDTLGMVGEPTADKLNEVLKGLGAFDEPIRLFIVKGTITYDNGKPCVEAMVTVYDKDLRTEELLGEAKTDDKGYYEIDYTEIQFIKADKNTADLVIVVSDPNRDVNFSQASDVVFNAADVQEINLIIVLPVPTEWETMNVQLLPLLKDQYPLPQTPNIYRDILPDELNDDDIIFLSNDTSIDQNYIQLWSLAYKSATEQPGIDAAIFYGWFRMELPTDPLLLWEQPVNSLLEALENAAEKNIIGSFEKDGLENMRAQLVNIRSGRVFP